MSDKTEETDSQEVIQSREAEGDAGDSAALPARVEGFDKQGRPKLLRVYYDGEQPELTRDHHEVVSVELGE